MNFDNLVIGGIGLGFLIPGLIEFLKKLGLSGEKNILIVGAALGFSFSAFAAALSENLIPEAVMPWIRVVAVGLGGIIVVASSIGHYDIKKKFSPQ